MYMVNRAMCIKKCVCVCVCVCVSVCVCVCVCGVSKPMSENLRVYSRGQNKKKSSYEYGFKNAFPPSYIAF